MTSEKANERYKDIIFTIMSQAAKVCDATGKEPECVYIGKDVIEFLEAQNEGVVNRQSDDSKCVGMKVAGMKIHPVDEDGHIAVGAFSAFTINL